LGEVEPAAGRSNPAQAQPLLLWAAWREAQDEGDASEQAERKRKYESKRTKKKKEKKGHLHVILLVINKVGVKK